MRENSAHATGPPHRILPDVASLESWKYCPRCGAGLEPLDGGAWVECPECGFHYYASLEADCVRVGGRRRGAHPARPLREGARPANGTCRAAS